jgi:hypothetical protein
MNRHNLRPARALLLGAVCALVATGSTAAWATGDRPTFVKGGGSGILTDPDGLSFPVQSFSVRARIGGDRPAKGSIRFKWRGSFARVWGDPVCDGTCDTIVLTGEVESGSVAPNGTIVIGGTAREIDKRRGEVVFDSGFDEPFEIIVVPGSDRFSLRWCLLPAFEVDGAIRASGGRGRATARTTASLRSATPCNRA